MNVLAIDFDGVIHDHRQPVPGRHMGMPMPMARECMQELAEAGHKLIIHSVKATSESGMEAIADWLNYYDIPCHEITAIKPIADWYIDDRALHFENWPQVLRELER